MKKILINSLFCSVALCMSACSDENKKLSQDAFKFKIEDESEKHKGKTYTHKKLLLTATDDIEIIKITANRGACKVYDISNKNITNPDISGNTPPKVCYDGILNYDWINRCDELVKWEQMSKADCNYKYKNGKLEKIEIPEAEPKAEPEVEEIKIIEGNKTIIKKIERDLPDAKEIEKAFKKAIDRMIYKEYTKNCEKAKEIIKEKHNGKYYYDYKVPMKFGVTKEFYIEDCPGLLEFSVHTNKGIATYNVN